MGLNTWPALIEFYGFVSVVVLLIKAPMSCGEGTNFQCLQEVHKSIQDPNNVLSSSWNFSNTTEGSICNFIGVECWNPEHSKVLNIRLEDMGLKGTFPQGLHLCDSLTGLYLSRNNFTGSLPSNISHLIPFVTVLELSDNDFSGHIPTNLRNCTYLHKLMLDDNQFSGQIPQDLGKLDRLNHFSVAGNNLSGDIPIFYYNSVTVDIRNNPGLCGGGRLDPCEHRTPTSALKHFCAHLNCFWFVLNFGLCFILSFFTCILIIKCPFRLACIK